jgi:hypothetical protein
MTARRWRGRRTLVGDVELSAPLGVPRRGAGHDRLRGL